MRLGPWSWSHRAQGSCPARGWEARGPPAPGSQRGRAGRGGDPLALPTPWLWASGLQSPGTASLVLGRPCSDRALEGGRPAHCVGGSALTGPQREPNRPSCEAGAPEGWGLPRPGGHGLRAKRPVGSAWQRGFNLAQPPGPRRCPWVQETLRRVQGRRGPFISGLLWPRAPSSAAPAAGLLPSSQPCSDPPGTPRLLCPACSLEEGALPQAPRRSSAEVGGHRLHH